MKKSLQLDSNKMYTITFINRVTGNVTERVWSGLKIKQEQQFIGLSVVDGWNVAIDEIEDSHKYCQRCSKNTVVYLTAFTGDKSHNNLLFKHGEREHTGVSLRGMGVTGNDGEADRYGLEFSFCTNCGQIQGEFPRPIHGRIINTTTDGYAEGDHEMTWRDK